MCTARTKLREVEQEMDCLYAELRRVNEKFDTAREETKAAEDESKRYANRCMRLTKNADIANLWMMYAFACSIISAGCLVYVI